MKTSLVVICVLMSSIFWLGCSGSSYHKHQLPDPASYRAHFPDMDKDGNEQVSWDEFKKYYPDTTPAVFGALDRNKDQSVDHDEWHEFKEAHAKKKGYH